MNFLKNLFKKKEAEQSVVKKTTKDCQLNGTYPFYSKPGWKRIIKNNIASVLFQGKDGKNEVLINLAYINGDDIAIIDSSKMSESKFRSTLKKALKVK